MYYFQLYYPTLSIPSIIIPHQTPVHFSNIDFHPHLTDQRMFVLGSVFQIWYSVPTNFIHIIGRLNRKLCKCLPFRHKLEACISARAIPYNRKYEYRSQPYYSIWVSKQIFQSLTQIVKALHSLGADMTVKIYMVSIKPNINS